MADTGNERELGKDSRHPHFIWVVLLSAAALILIFIGSYIVIAGKGRRLIPPKQRDTHSTSCLTQPEASEQYAALGSPSSHFNDPNGDSLSGDLVIRCQSRTGTFRGRIA
jgi:hypothetical protein